MQYENQNFMTRDLFLAAAIWCSDHELNITLQNKVAWFCFDGNPHVREVAAQFTRGTLNINAQKFASAYRKLKNAMMDSINQASL